MNLNKIKEEINKLSDKFNWIKKENTVNQLLIIENQIKYNNKLTNQEIKNFNYILELLTEYRKIENEKIK